jgi:cysteine-rich repeat protein
MAKALAYGSVSLGVIALGFSLNACGDDSGGESSGGSSGTGGKAGGGSGGVGGSSGSSGGGAGGTAAVGGSPSGCGDGTISGEEQCDDSNTANYDGCDLQCRAEVVLRMSSVAIHVGATPSWCSRPENGLGTALTELAVNQVNDGLTSGIANGGTNILVQALGLDDLTGQSDGDFNLGITTGKTDPAAGTWPANDPLDWSFLLDPGTLDANGFAKARLAPSKLSGGALTGGPSTVGMQLSISGSPALLEILEGRAVGRVGTATSKPPVPAALSGTGMVFETIAADGDQEGLCGNVTVDSLAKIAIPQALTEAATKCGDCPDGSVTYTYCGDGAPVGPNCNSLLDALVGGCKVIACAAPVIIPTQPNVKNGGATLAPEGALHKVPEAQTNGNRDAYTSYFKFTAKRQRITGQQPPQ